MSSPDQPSYPQPTNILSLTWLEQGGVYEVTGTYSDGEWMIWVPESVWKIVRPRQQFYPGPIVVPVDDLRIRDQQGGEND